MSGFGDFMIEETVKKNQQIRELEEKVSRLQSDLAAARADAWQPIETAPRNGKSVLLYQEWKSGRPTILIGWYANGWVSDGYGDDLIDHQPTHWRPLPLSPTVSEGADEGGATGDGHG